jgi:hypothetical protein
MIELQNINKYESRSKAASVIPALLEDDLILSPNETLLQLFH